MMDRFSRCSVVLLVLLTLAVGGCASGEADPEVATDTLTREQKDSLLGTMPVPGAGAVGGALEARDRLNQRADQHDTIR